MISLFIDTSYKCLYIAIVKNNVLIDSIHMMSEANFSENLIPSLERMINNNNLNLKDINKIFVTVGPGSFTGIRIGVTVCKILGFALNKNIIPISSLEFMATTNVNTDYKIPFIDARHNMCFAGVYDKNGNNIINDSYCDINSLINSIDGSITYIGYDDIGLENFIIPNYDVVSIINKHISDKELNPHKINPNYLKKTEAEEKL